MLLLGNPATILHCNWEMSGRPVSSTSKTHKERLSDLGKREKSKVYKLNCPYPGGESGKVLGSRFDAGITHFATKLNDPLLLTGPGSKALLRFSRFPNLLLLFGSLIPVGVSSCREIRDLLRWETACSWLNGDTIFSSKGIHLIPPLS